MSTVTVEQLRQAREALEARIHAALPLPLWARTPAEHRRNLALFGSSVSAVAVGASWAGVDEAQPGTDGTAAVTLPQEAHEASPDDTQLSYEAWCAKVEAVLAECEAQQCAGARANPFFEV